MTRAIGFHLPPTSQPTRSPPPPSTRTRIDIDLDNLQEYRGIKPDDVLVTTWNKDTSRETVSADQLLAASFPSLKSQSIDTNAPISFTFRAAVKFVVELINANAADKPPGKGVQCFTSEEPYSTLYFALTNNDTLRPDLVPAPPQYDSPCCAADPNENSHWLGVVLRMLLDLGHITAYGRKGLQHWVTF